MNKLAVWNVSLYGLLTGLLLTLFLKIVEQATHYKVYTLLLNVDYIPILNGYAFPEVVEIGFHLIISFVLSVCLYILIRQLKMTTKRGIIFLCAVVCLLVGGMLFPTTAFSDRTPSITSIPALGWWLTGHVIYGYAFGVLLACSPER